MLKKDELTNTDSCLNKAKDDEWIFVLLGRDKAAPVAVKAWIDERIRLGKNLPSDPQILEAEQWIKLVAQKKFIVAPVQPIKNYRDFSSGFRLDTVEVSGKTGEGCRYGYWYAIGGAWHLRGESLILPQSVESSMGLILVDGKYGWMIEETLSAEELAKEQVMQDDGYDQHTK